MGPLLIPGRGSPSPELGPQICSGVQAALVSCRWSEAAEGPVGQGWGGEETPGSALFWARVLLLARSDPAQTRALSLAV